MTFDNDQVGHERHLTELQAITDEDQVPLCEVFVVVILHPHVEIVIITLEAHLGGDVKVINGQ
jgi:hypothetical protein